jgi:hypothetical protein
MAYGQSRDVDRILNRNGVVSMLRLKPVGCLTAVVRIYADMKRRILDIGKK